MATGRVQHQPVAAGECATCHQPHTSAHPALLTQAPRALCSACHSRQAVTFGLSAHSGFQSQCAACHQPHGSDHADLLFAATNALCDTCHDDLPHGFHPVSGNGLSCASCHAPHGSANPADLRAPGDALCLTCHDFQAPASVSER
ncbi:MAG: hypothetical protein HUU23_10425 [Caldilineales bacterium]|nr:hypothetical protein [Caldilineales bacterium]